MTFKFIFLILLIHSLNVSEFLVITIINESSECSYKDIGYGDYEIFRILSLYTH